MDNTQLRLINWDRSESHLEELKDFLTSLVTFSVDVCRYGINKQALGDSMFQCVVALLINLSGVLPLSKMSDQKGFGTAMQLLYTSKVSETLF